MAEDIIIARIEELKDQGKLLDAIKVLQNELHDNPGHLTYLNSLTHCLIQNRDLKDAAVALGRAKKIDIKDGASTTWNEVRLLLANNKPGDAYTLAVEQYNRHPHDVEGMVLISACLRTANRVEESLIWINKALDLEPANASAHINRGLIEIVRKNNSQAACHLMDAHKLRPKLKKIWPLIIKTHMQTKNYCAASDFIANIILIDPDFENAVELFDTCSAKCSDLSNIREKFETLTSPGSSDTRTYLLLGITYKNMGEYEKSLQALYESARLDTLCFRAPNYLGVTYQALNETNKAIEQFKESISINSKYALAHFNLATSLTAAGDYTSAINAYKNVLLYNPENAVAYINSGALLKEQGKLQEAIVAFKKAVEINPSYPEANYNIGLIQYESGDYPSAISSLQKDARAKSQTVLMKCYYTEGQETAFYRKMDDLVQMGVNNAVIGSYLSRGKLKFGASTHNPFCNFPLDYVYTSDLKKVCNFNETFVRSAEEILMSNKIEKREQSLLSNAEQTAGNVFDQFELYTQEIREIIFTEVEKYRSTFMDSNEGFIREWPEKYNIKGWLVSMNSGGAIAPHIHDSGWISGSIYINIPDKNEKDSGNLVVSTGEKEFVADGVVETKSIDVVTGSMCLFPSSLLHHTIPFQSAERRTVLAFDIVPV